MEAKEVIFHSICMDLLICCFKENSLELLFFFYWERNTSLLDEAWETGSQLNGLVGGLLWFWSFESEMTYKTVVRRLGLSSDQRPSNDQIRVQDDSNKYQSKILTSVINNGFGLVPTREGSGNGPSRCGSSITANGQLGAGEMEEKERRFVGPTTKTLLLFSLPLWTVHQLWWTAHNAKKIITVLPALEPTLAHK